MNRPRFEQTRASLHHDRLKNEFLGTMGYYPTEAGSQQRSRIMREALAGDQKQRRRLREGCELWADLRRDIQEFLVNLSSRYGFVLTDAFQTERAEVESALDVLDGITAKIEDGSFAVNDVETFWGAADKVRGLLGDMARYRRFSEFVLDIDLSLISEDRDA